MDSHLQQQLLSVQLHRQGQAVIAVTGVSMNPTLLAGDFITIAPSPTYTIGDILVFRYKHRELLVHRLLDIREGRYYCKGDNALRMEDILPEQIFGRVTAIERHGQEVLMPPCNTRSLTLSRLVNRAFLACRYDAEKTKQTYIYQLYQRCILQQEEDIMLYRKNQTMDYIPTDETSLAVFDPNTGDTHFFDECGMDILSLLEEPRDLEGLLAGLCEIYDATPEDIRGDVVEFLQETVEKGIVETL